MAKKAELAVREILLSTGLVIPVKMESQCGHLSALCREVPNQASKWMEAVQSLLSHASESPTFKFHLCRQYVWKDGRMVFGWHVGINADSVKELDLHIELMQQVWKNVSPDLVAPEIAPATSVVAQPVHHVEEDVEEEEELKKLDEVQAKGLSERRGLYQKKTNAPPRPPSSAGTVPQPPPGFEPELRVVFRGKMKDRSNRMVPVVVEEFPLPHTFVEDMNVPNEKGRGAKTLG